MGITKNDAEINLNLLDNELKNELNEVAERRLVVINPIQLNIVNFDDYELTKTINLPNFPNISIVTPDRQMNLTKAVYIEKSSFKEHDEKGFYGLALGKTIRLKYSVFLEYVNYNKETNIVDVKIVNPEINFKKVKGILNWVGDDSINATLNIFDGLKCENKTILVEPSLVNSKMGDRFQFERHGYFYTVNNLIFNQLVTSK